VYAYVSAILLHIHLRNSYLYRFFITIPGITHIGKINFLGGIALRSKNTSKYHISRIIDKKIPFEDLPLKTMKVTIHALRWIFLLIFLFITVGIFILFATGGQTYLQSILGYSITGFFTFFMGYFGWILARGIMEMVTGKDDSSEPGLTYYLKKDNNYRY